MKLAIKIKLFLLVFFIVLTVSGCVSNDKDKFSMIRVAHFPNITHAQALIGRAEGHFQGKIGEGTRLEWKEFNAGPAVIEAILAGEIDIAYIGPGPAINGYVKSRGEIQIISGASSGGAVFITRRDLVINDIKEINSKKIAVPQFGNTQDLMLRDLLLKNGLKDSSKGGNVDIFQAKNSDIMTLLDKGDIDGALVPEPWGSIMEKQVGAKIFLDYDQVFNNGDYATAVIIARSDYLRREPDLVKKFLQAHVEVTELINKDLDRAKAVTNNQLQKLTKKALNPQVLDKSFSKISFTLDPGIAANIKFIDISAKIGFLKKLPDTNMLYNLDVLNEVLQEKGLEQIN